MSERKDPLPTFGIGHAVYADGIADIDVRHILGSDEDILFAIGRIRSIDLKGQHE